jgi:ferredoxin
MNTRLRAVIDRTECFSFANCVETLPSVFYTDREGKSVARDVDASEGLLKEAVDGCPRAAIVLVDEDGRIAYPQASR